MLHSGCFRDQQSKPPRPPSRFSVSLFSPPALILIYPGVPFASQKKKKKNLLACSDAMHDPHSPPPPNSLLHNCNRNAVALLKKIRSSTFAPGDSCIKLSMFLHLALVSVILPGPLGCEAYKHWSVWAVLSSNLLEKKQKSIIRWKIKLMVCDIIITTVQRNFMSLPSYNQPFIAAIDEQII